MRGKCSNRAAGRRETVEIEQSEAAYRRQIVRLTQERDEARKERDDARSAWRKETRELTARLAEAAAPRVTALIRELERVRERNDHLQREIKKRKQLVEKRGRRMLEHFTAEHGMTEREAIQRMMHMIDPKTAESMRVVVGPGEKKLAERDGFEVLDQLIRRRG